MAPSKKIITCPDCGRTVKHYSLGFCEACYTRKRRQSKKIEKSPPKLKPREELMEKFQSWMRS
jgi:NMD protein affecting ribosome stability and mRNA decay